MEDFFKKHILGVFILMFIINTIWMVVIDQNTMAIGFVSMAGLFAILYESELRDKD